MTTPRTPLYKVETCHQYPDKWVWLDRKHFAAQAEAEEAAREASQFFWKVRVMGRARTGKWVTVGQTIYNGNTEQPVMIGAA